MKKDPIIEAINEAYEAKLSTARDGVAAAITAQEATKRAPEEAEKKNAAKVAGKKREDVASKKEADGKTKKNAAERTTIRRKRWEE